jgi:regulator of protease activity HflC (stomatin/prohibitin superfamily)
VNLSSEERPIAVLPGAPMVLVVLLVGVAGLVLVALARVVGPGAGVPGVVLLLAAVAAFRGFVVVQPNQSMVVTFFGAYAGTLRQAGLSWINPLTVRRSVSLRVRNFESDVVKVNDANGNPVEIAAVINWQVTDTARAVFDVDDYEEFVRIQTETAIRHVASSYPYDNYEEDQPSLRANPDQVMDTLRSELQDRLDLAGVAILAARIRRLNYAPEIAGEMLRRQQASAVVAARSRIVEGAVGMVERALSMLNESELVELDEERKAAMVSNLMVVLSSDRGVQPVVNTGTLYT